MLHGRKHKDCLMEHCKVCLLCKIYKPASFHRQIYPELLLCLVVFCGQKPSGMQVLSDRFGVSWDCNVVQVMCVICGLHWPEETRLVRMFILSWESPNWKMYNVSFIIHIGIPPQKDLWATYYLLIARSLSLSLLPFGLSPTQVCRVSHGRDTHRI